MLRYEEIPSKIKAAHSPLGKRHAAADRKLAERDLTSGIPVTFYVVEPFADRRGERAA
jgi:hypothetical protein